MGGSNFDVRYKAVARRTTDRVYPKVRVRVGGSDAQFSLFPGAMKNVGNTSPHSASDVLKVVLKLQGKVKRKRIAVGNLGRC